MNYLNRDDLNDMSPSHSISIEQATSLIIERSKELVDKVIQLRGNNKPPFLPSEFSQLLNIKKIQALNLGNSSGILLKLPEGYVINVNRNQNIARQTFSCAHEIGHILISDLKLDKLVHAVEFRTFNPQANSLARAAAIERLCDMVAVELLMPELIFIKYIKGFGVKIDSVARLADIFRVSLRAAVRRIAEVSIEPCISLVWQPILRTKLLHLVQCSGPGRKTIYSPKYTQVKPPSVLHKALEKTTKTNCYRTFKYGTEEKRFYMESRGFGNDKYRCVVSLAFPKP